VTPNCRIIDMSIKFYLFVEPFFGKISIVSFHPLSFSFLLLMLSFRVTSLIWQKLVN